MDDSISISCYYIAASALAHFEANPVFWLATWADKMGPSCPLGIARFKSAQERKLLGANLQKSS